MHSEATQVKAAFNAGANGYVTKGSDPSELIRAIRSVVRGEPAISDDIAHVLAMESLSPSGSALDQLGEREIEILRQLAAGATTDQIAANLNLSIKTVQNYHYLIKTKTGMLYEGRLIWQAEAMLAVPMWMALPALAYASGCHAVKRQNADTNWRRSKLRAPAHRQPFARLHDRAEQSGATAPRRGGSRSTPAAHRRTRYDGPPRPGPLPCRAM